MMVTTLCNRNRRLKAWDQLFIRAKKLNRPLIAAP